jgi:hypothetical protein
MRTVTKWVKSGFTFFLLTSFWSQWPFPIGTPHCHSCFCYKTLVLDHGPFHRVAMYSHILTFSPPAEHMFDYVLFPVDGIMLHTLHLCLHYETLSSTSIVCWNIRMASPSAVTKPWNRPAQPLNGAGDLGTLQWTWATWNSVHTMKNDKYACNHM